MNPTREQFEMAARAIGETVVTTEAEMHGCLPNSTIYTGVMLEGIQDAWKPHLPGTDNAMLAAALGEYRTNTTEFGCIVHVGDSYHICEHDAFDGTETERRARAMAWATFMVAVEIGRGMK